jgi:hypothetical protein
MKPSQANTRRWQRHQVDLQVYVVIRSGGSKVVVPGRLSEISKGGMALYAGIHLLPGEPMEVEFPTPNVRVIGTIRNRAGYCYGVEFLTSPSTRTVPANRALTLFQQRHEAYLRKNEQEIDRLQREIAALRRAALLADEIKKL